MADSFDPYRKWLGIVPKDQPPNLYRLLGIELFESDPDVIEGAADRQMAHLRTFQAGPHSAQSQKLLNECSAARLTLLDPQKRADYDRQLRAKMAPSQPASPAESAALPLPSSEGVSPRTQPQPIISGQPARMPVARPLPQAAPLPLREAAPVIVRGEAGSTSSIHQRPYRKTPIWRQPAVLGTLGALAIFAGIGYALNRSGKMPTEVAGTTPSPNTLNSAPPRPPNTDKPPPSVAEKSSATTTVAPTNVESPREKSVVSSADFEILAATWGADDKWVDVTAGVRSVVKDNRLMMIVWSDLFGKPEDPAPGVGKKLRIRYRSRGKEYTAEYFDLWFVYLDGNPLAPPTDSPDALELLEARYGAGGTFVDVLPQLRQHLHNGRLAVCADEFAGITAAELDKHGIGANIYKVLWVRYRNATGEHFTYAWNSAPVVIESRLPAAAGPPVDLLTQIDLKRDVVQGSWAMEDGALRAPGTQFARVQLPYDPPAEYMLTVTAEGESEIKDIGGLLVVGDKQVMAVVDGFLGNRSGVQAVSGKLLSEDNPTCRWRCARLLEQGRPNTIVSIVRSDSVRVLRDGAEIIRWSGNPATFSIPDRWKTPNSRRLSLQAYDTPFRVSKLELTPLKPERSPMLIVGDSGSPLDVLAAIDLDRDRLRGDWQLDGKTLVSPSSSAGTLQLPVIVPSDYQLDVVAQRESGGDNLAITLPIAGTCGTLIIDGYGGTTAGLQMIDGKDFMANETTREAQIFADGKPHSVNIRVQKNHVCLFCDGKPLVDWEGDVGRLKDSENVPYQDRVYIGTWTSRYRLTQIKVRPLRGDAADETSPALAGKPIDLLKQIDAKRDAVSGEWQMADGVLVSPDVPFARLLLPPPPAPEYQVTIVGEKVQGNWGIALGVVVGGHQTVVEVDGFDGNFTGLTALDGKNCNENETARQGRLLVDGKSVTLVYTVRRNGIKLGLDGNTVIDWHGDPSRLSMIDGYKLPDPNRLALCEYKTVCRISKIEVAPLASESTSAGGQLAMAASDKAPLGLLKVFEDEPEFVDDLTGDNGKAELSRKEKYSGQASVMITGKQRYREELPGFNVKIRKEPKAPDEYRYLRFAWKKRGGNEICFQLHHANNWFRYSAGAGNTFRPAIKLAEQPPADFAVVTRDVAADFGEFNLNGFALSAVDGEWACFDHIYLARALGDFDHIEALPGNPPDRKFADLASGKQSAGGKETRLAMPDEETVKKARQEMLKKYSSQIGVAKSPDQKRGLSQQLAQKAAAAGKDGAEAYVLLNQAIDLAEASGDIDLAWQTIDQLAQSFAVDSLALKNQSLTEIGKSSKTPEQAWALADAASRLIVAALTAGDAAAVKKVGAQAQSFAKRTKDRTVQKTVTSRANDAGKLAGEIEAVAAARETLKKSPDDAKANFTVGHYELCAAGDCDAALPKLAKSDDAEWRKLASDELALDDRRTTGNRRMPRIRTTVTNQSTEATRQLELADGWWSRAESEPWPGSHYLHQRAAHWYTAAQSSLVDINRARANERLKALLAVDEGLPNWELFRWRGFQTEQPNGDILRIDRNRGIETAVEYQGPIDVTLLARTTGTEIRLHSHNWSWNWDFKVEPNRWHTLRYVITPISRTAFLNGVPVHNETSKTARQFNPAPVYIYLFDDAIIEIKKFIVQSTE